MSDLKYGTYEEGDSSVFAAHKASAVAGLVAGLAKINAGTEDILNDLGDGERIAAGLATLALAIQDLNQAANSVALLDAGAGTFVEFRGGSGERTTRKVRSRKS